MLTRYSSGTGFTTLELVNTGATSSADQTFIPDKPICLRIKQTSSFASTTGVLDIMIPKEFVRKNATGTCRYGGTTPGDSCTGANNTFATCIFSASNNRFSITAGSTTIAANTDFWVVLENWEYPKVGSNVWDIYEACLTYKSSANATFSHAGCGKMVIRGADLSDADVELQVDSKATGEYVPYTLKMKAPTIVQSTTTAKPYVRLYLPTRDEANANNAWDIDAGVTTGTLICNYSSDANLSCLQTKASSVGNGNYSTITVSNFVTIGTTHVDARFVLKNPTEAGQDMAVKAEIGIYENFVYKVLYTNENNGLPGAPARRFSFSAATAWTDQPICGKQGDPANARLVKYVNSSTLIGCTLKAPVLSVADDLVFFRFPAGWNLSSMTSFSIDG
jgi:hypothetical protein